jgi:mono/diheme cytochrome c family protein
MAAVCALAVFGASCGPSEAEPVGRGRQVFNLHCASCHSLDPGVVIVGPSLAGVAGRAVEQGSDPRAYLERAVLEPAAEIVPGFQNLMPVDFDRRLSPGELEALFGFLLTLD